LLKKAFLTALSLALLAGGVTSVSSAQQSDWVEDDRTATQAPPIAPDRNAPAPQKSPGPGGFLTGSASEFRTSVPARPMSGRALSPRYAEAQANLGADADMYIANVRKDTVVTPEQMKGWVDRTHPEFRLSAQSNPSAVVEVKGAWDKAGQILTAIGVRHQQIKARDLRQFDLDNTRVLIVNCEGKVPEDAMEKIRQWVVRGGYLISTDWTLDSFTARAFPGMIAWNGAKTPGTTVDAIIVDNDPVLLRGVPAARTPWKLDEESQMVRVLRPDVVRVLARSFKLGSRDPNRRQTADPNQWGVLACEFPYGRGRVLHLVGHYDYNSPTTFTRHILPDAIPGAGIGLRQALSTNFLLQALAGPAKASSAPR
jgi:hypothetical protein